MKTTININSDTEQVPKDKIEKENLLQDSTSLIKEQTLIVYNKGLNYKFINLITTIDRVGKLESIFVIGHSIKSKGNNYQTSYLDKAIEEYNKLNI